MQKYFTHNYKWEMILSIIGGNIWLLFFAFLMGRILEGSWAKLTLKEKSIVCGVFVVNTLVTILGYLMVVRGLIVFSDKKDFLWVLLDTLILLVGMDFWMFIFHWMAHKWKFLYRFHHLHHQHIDTRVEDLFQLHPVEALGFGIIWLLYISIFQFSLISIFIYLSINFLWGLLGHYSKEVIPSKYWISKMITNTSFHRKHHHQEKYNYGFYFTLWDNVLEIIKAKRNEIV